LDDPFPKVSDLFDDLEKKYSLSSVVYKIYKSLPKTCKISIDFLFQKYFRANLSDLINLKFLSIESNYISPKELNGFVSKHLVTP